MSSSGGLPEEAFPNLQGKQKRDGWMREGKAGAGRGKGREAGRGPLSPAVGTADQAGCAGSPVVCKVSEVGGGCPQRSHEGAPRLGAWQLGGVADGCQLLLQQGS